MKKLVTLSFIALGFLTSTAQTTEEVESVSNGPDLKHWAIDFGAGVNKPVRPVSSGVFTNTPSLYQVDLGVRYMFNNKFGINADFGYDNIEGDKESVDFQSDYYRFTLEGVVNAAEVLGAREWTQRFGLLLHGGMGVSFLKGSEPVETGTDHMLNFQAGVTPQIKLTNSLALFGDLSILGHVRQDLTFDGVDRGTLRGFDGFLVNASVGITLYLGSGDTPADFAESPINAKVEDIAAKMEKMAQENGDDDQDGVPNYLDRDNNTESGVRVDSKGRAIDLNKNGIPDDMESALDSRFATPSDLQTAIAGNNGANGNNKNLVKQLINEGYVNVYFKFNSTKPATFSLGAINTIVQYMKDNPSATATLTGFADEIGSPAYNKNLSERRAKMVNDVLTAAGIDASRLSHNGDGEDASVDKNSAEARQLVRRVTFRVN
ncbi:OOP family OmpA-OmpF porin [Nonlabens xylanidelens]|uniref:OOP family OmpA-OmpF porin n=1 Tax=Nonlabens xylanidelens TaxID=191564 RepID=A0A2S6IGE2_9FLAO|nr:OmpA family protein [Nonlabens xylanidelens]PPK93257.1 OOP family OmpA-OmpF porin [Nonlabens xylanidelens]PQJ20919.1 cell envelope biogenesis protein OmpA [Nonlabens xylanidelens]